MIWGSAIRPRPWIRLRDRPVRRLLSDLVPFWPRTLKRALRSCRVLSSHIALSRSCAWGLDDVGVRLAVRCGSDWRYFWTGASLHGPLPAPKLWIDIEEVNFAACISSDTLYLRIFCKLVRICKGENFGSGNTYLRFDRESGMFRISRFASRESILWKIRRFHPHLRMKFV